ncbi:hypothetical protein [Abyssisolibacter fermentans]|uniref:hypothetical protein n=1 Tax=Abyssisolibacter fermentans TaxID=1766203 RepID=UPI0008356854|nr:hypothetical protein [Abyssisolibacter fermentans]
MALIDDVKISLGITTDDTDIMKSIDLKIKAVQVYLTNAGATEASINTELGTSCIVIGVNDMLNQKAGEMKFSPAFKILANQVCRG